MEISKCHFTLSMTQYTEQDLSFPTHAVCVDEIFTSFSLYNVEFLLGRDEV